MTAIPLQGTPAWYEWRRNGVGASDMPAILGEDPWTGEYQLALEKRGLSERPPENEAQRWGKRVQRVALEMYAEAIDVPVRNVNTTIVSRRYPHVYASLDGRWQGVRRGVEVKLTKDGWDDGPPRRVLIQCQVQMGVVELDSIDVVKVSGGYAAPQVFTVERNDVEVATFLRLGEAWYRRYVLGDELPAVDGSRAASRHLDAMQGDPEMKAGPDEIALALEVHRLRAQKRHLEKVAEPEAVNRLKDAMHGSYVMAGGGVRVTWKPERDRVEVGHEAIAAAYRRLLDAQVSGEAMEALSEAERAIARTLRPDELDAIASLHTVTRPGNRPVRVTLKEEDPDD